MFKTFANSIRIQTWKEATVYRPIEGVWHELAGGVRRRRDREVWIEKKGGVGNTVKKKVKKKSEKSDNNHEVSLVYLMVNKQK